MSLCTYMSLKPCNVYQVKLKVMLVLQNIRQCPKSQPATSYTLSGGSATGFFTLKNAIVICRINMTT